MLSIEKDIWTGEGGSHAVGRGLGKGGKKEEKGNIHRRVKLRLLLGGRRTSLKSVCYGDEGGGKKRGKLKVSS